MRRIAGGTKDGVTSALALALARVHTRRTPRITIHIRIVCSYPYPYCSLDTGIDL